MCDHHVARKPIGVRDVTSWLSLQRVRVLEVVTACYIRPDSRTGKPQ